VSDLQLSAERPKSAAAETATERTVKDIWEEVLNQKGIGTTADFFDLGGTSLDLIRVFERVNETFDISLDGSALEDDATIARLAATIDAETRKS
jgi:acyl carrier protein